MSFATGYTVSNGNYTVGTDLSAIFPKYETLSY